MYNKDEGYECPCPREDFFYTQNESGDGSLTHHANTLNAKFKFHISALRQIQREATQKSTNMSQVTVP
jgi:hypothetical protein